jgi:hypothetical protein
VEKNELYYGDNLEVLRQHVKDESVDLIYLDPPFNGRQDYNVLFAEKDGSAPARRSWLSRMGICMTKSQFRFGIGEWYGKPFASMSPTERQKYAELQFQLEAPVLPCPFLSTDDVVAECSKKGGVCSLRMYERKPDGRVEVDVGRGTLRVTCPNRFEQDSTIYAWIGEVLLGSIESVPIGQINFLERTPLMAAEPVEGGVQPVEEVGRIDNVLAVPGSNPLKWCPVEIQAVYFSGKKMELDFEDIRSGTSQGIPFPLVTRRPDYRSSGPKRLMPQLLVKVPTLRRWGKKMAVVVDEDFFGGMGKMEPVGEVSNCDVAWFVVKFSQGESGFTLERKEVFLTTLENSQNGLVAARPVSKERFEKRILDRLPKLSV